MGQGTRQVGSTTKSATCQSGFVIDAGLFEQQIEDGALVEDAGVVGQAGRARRPTNKPESSKVIF